MKQGKYQRKPVRRSNGTKLGLILLAVTMLIGSTIGGTFAYLMDQTEAVTNTFTVGDVGTLTLKENGEEITAATTKSFTIVPGVDIKKQPSVTYRGNNIRAYVFVEVTPGSWTLNNNTYSIKQGDEVVMSWTVDTNNWTAVDGKPGVYYKEVAANTSLTDVKFMTEIDTTEGTTVDVSYKITEGNIEAVANAAGLTFTAYAIQADGFTTAADAWSAIKPSSN